MKLSKILLNLLLILSPLSLKAQHMIKVLDSENLRPVAGVTVMGDSVRLGQTDARGQISIVEKYDTIAFTHLRYAPEKLSSKEVGDTVLLVSSDHLLPEVKVTDLSPEKKEQIQGWVDEAAQQGAADAPKGLVNFDFFKIFDKRGRIDRKHLKKARKVLEEWDEKKVKKPSSDSKGSEEDK